MIPSSHVNEKLFSNEPNDSKPELISPRCKKALGFSGLLMLIAVIVIVCYLSFGTGKHSDGGHPISLSADTDSELSSLDDTTSYYKADGEDDLMTSMPLLNEESCSDSPTECGFNQYSGYLLATDNNEIHYWFTEADTEGDPMEKPLFFWTNGGPGCSGMEGLLVEEGPWRVISTDGELSVEYNPFTWITEVNMVFLEQPYGVGFSVVEEGDDPVVGDENAALDMDAVIRNFITKFPRFENHPIYTTAESWGLCLLYML